MINIDFTKFMFKCINITLSKAFKSYLMKLKNVHTCKTEQEQRNKVFQRFGASMFEIKTFNQNWLTKVDK